MARETKVGLLVGLGIILLVGIIVSDHLSVAQQQQPADLTSLADRAILSVNKASQSDGAEGSEEPSRADSAEWARRSFRHKVPEEINKDHGVLGVGSTGGSRGALGTSEVGTARADDPQPAARPGDVGRPENLVSAARVGIGEVLEVPVVTPGSRGRSIIGEATRGERTVVGQANRAERSLVRRPATTVAPLIHEVRSGESLWVIAEKYYGNGGYWKRIADANRGVVDAAGSVREGVKLAIPDKAGLADRSGVRGLGAGHGVGEREPRREREGSIRSADVRGSGGGSPRGEVKTVVVREGDTLSSLAARHMGAEKYWPKLYKANRDQLHEADDIRVGQVLRLPN